MLQKLCKTLFLLGVVTFCVEGVFAAPNRDFKPTHGSIKSHIVNVRAGPGTTYPILWVYKMRGYPVRAIAHYGGWYKIVDIEGETGWVYQSFFSTKKTVMAHQTEGHKAPTAPIPFYKTREAKVPKFLLEEGVIMLLDHCSLGVCYVQLSGHKGWVRQELLRFP